MRKTVAPLLAVIMTALIVCALFACRESRVSGQDMTVEHGAAVREENSAPSRGFEELAFPPALSGPPVLVKVPVLMYHHIGEPPPGADRLRRALTVPAQAFEQQMAYLAQAGYNPVTQTQLFKALYYGQPLPPKPVMLTFDDGYQDSYTVAAPILAKHSFPATFYILTGSVGDAGYMDWRQIIELDQRGMDIGSHTISHKDLTRISPEERRRQLFYSAIRLYQKLGHPVYWFCYPSGKYNEAVETRVNEAGYLLATTTDPGEQQSSQSPYAIPRYRMEAGTGMDRFIQLVE